MANPTNDPGSYSILRIDASALIFGCLRASDLAGQSVSILIFEDARTKHWPSPPIKGSHMLCRKQHSSVYVPVALVNVEHLWLRRILPTDLAFDYFPLCQRWRSKSR